ncbi:MAG: hypothetical protein L6R38_002422 [Xanthoria sp. 2 TBL-2021]|nr:MAG: hypothetical protein L6R38_002422 [Xanthoria sp. 2 TBL-2021]
MTAYVYDKLDPNRKQIRICTIYPGAFDDPIRCSLRTVSLDHHLEYETLSYTWGAPVFDHTLLVDGALLKITRSLHNAMRYLRRQERLVSKEEKKSSSDNAFEIDETTMCSDTEASGVLWADAICINQADIDERSSQVGYMGDIYRRGSRLHIWVGTVEEVRESLRHRYPREPQPDYELANPEQLAEFKTFLVSEGITPPGPRLLASASNGDVDADIMGAMELAQLLAEDKHVQDLPFFKFTAIDMNLEKDEFWYKSIATLVGILTQPWWKRVWVVQEVVLSTSTKAALLHISQHKMSLSSCDNLRKYFLKHLLGCCHKWYAIVVNRYHLLHRLYDAVYSLDALKMVAERYREGIVDVTVAYEICPLREATDPHDYIYGIYALMQDSPSDLLVDYRMPISLLYVAATSAIFRAHCSLEYLEVAVGVDSEDRYHLPSWGVDWSEHTNGQHIHGQDTHGQDALYIGLNLFRAAAGCTFQLLGPCEDNNALLVEAAAEGPIICMTTVIEMTAVDPVDAVVEWMENIGRHQYFRDNNTNIVLIVLLRDYYVDRELSFQRISHHMEILEEWRRFIRENKRRPNRTTGEARLRQVDYRMQRRQRLFITSHGLLGAGPPTMRKGDCLFIAKGSELPLILRPIHDSAIENGQQDPPSYQFVGRCYVHGIMDGEAVTADTEWRTIRLY